MQMSFRIKDDIDRDAYLASSDFAYFWRCNPFLLFIEYAKQSNPKII
jgi:hypothetical protein